MRCHEPLAEADFGVLEDDSQQYWERVVAVGAAEPAITAFVNVCASAFGAAHVFTLTLFLEGFAAFVIDSKIRDEFDEGVGV